MKLYLDPGHGGRDSGGTGNGMREKDIVLDIALKIRDILQSEYEDVSVRMSRTSDTHRTLASRTRDANNWGADYFLSVHTNAFNGSATGYEDYIHSSLSSNSQTASYQNIMHEEISKVIGLPNKGKKSANFHVLRETNMSAILTENGFIDNSSDAAKMKTSSWRNDVARGHVNGLAKAFNLKKKSSGGNSGGFLYLVQIGAFSDLENARALENQAKSNGFDAYIKPEGSLYKVQIGAFSDKNNAAQLKRRAENAGFDVFITN